jgi:hypothetical protein
VRDRQDSMMGLTIKECSEKYLKSRKHELDDMVHGQHKPTIFVVHRSPICPKATVGGDKQANQDSRKQ